MAIDLAEGVLGTPVSAAAPPAQAVSASHKQGFIPEEAGRGAGRMSVNGCELLTTMVPLAFGKRPEKPRYPVERAMRCGPTEVLFEKVALEIV